jgi:hypothetical protein
VIGDRDFASELCIKKAPVGQRLAFDADPLKFETVRVVWKVRLLAGRLRLPRTHSVRAVLHFSASSRS